MNSLTLLFGSAWLATIRTWFGRSLVVLATFLTTLSATLAGEVVIDAAHHALEEGLRAHLQLPPGAAPESPVPICVVIHGSGGLFRENDPGQACGTELESNFQGLVDRLGSLGVASLAPSSFASRDSRFCEDNDVDYLQFAPAPFFNPGDGPPQRDDAYKIRRVVIRTLDVLAAANYACSLDSVDCNRMCLVGTSNGGTTLMAYIANDLQRHLAEFTEIKVQREHESVSQFEERQLALNNFPALPLDLDSEIATRSVPQFAQAVSPGCSLRRLVPTISPDDTDFEPAQHRDDLYYPADPAELHLEIGTADTVPDACYNGGIREEQARAFEALSGTDPSRYRIHTHVGAGHDLLRERPVVVHGRLDELVRFHFFPPVFADGFEQE